MAGRNVGPNNSTAARTAQPELAKFKIVGSPPLTSALAKTRSNPVQCYRLPSNFPQAYIDSIEAPPNSRTRSF